MEKPGILKTSGISMFIAFMTLIVYFQTQAHEFVTIGDSEFIYNNSNITNGINAGSLKWAFFSTRENIWMPLTRLSFILDYKFHRLNPTWYHLENVIIHILNSLLLFLILKRATLKILRSAFAATLFALHPINVGVVAWASGRKEVLSAFFFLLSIVAYMNYLKKPGRFRYNLIFVTFILAIFSYPLAAVLPAALLLFDQWPLRRTESIKFRALLIEKIPLLAVSGITGIFSLNSYFSLSYLTPPGSISFFSRIVNVPVSYTSYISKLVIPLNFSALYPYPAFGIDIWKGITAGLILTVITYILIKSSDKFKFLNFGWMWFLFLMLPVSGLFSRGFEVMADRHAYIPFMGLFIIAAWGIPEIFEKYFANLKYKYLNNFCIGLLIILTLISRNEVSKWKTSITLYEHASSSVKDNYLAYNGLGKAMEDKGNPSDAVKFYRKAITANQDYGPSYNNLGKALLKIGRTGDALEVFDKSLRLNPDMPETNYYLGSIMFNEGKPDDAEIYLKHALEVKPDYIDALAAVGMIEVGRNNLTVALEYFNKVLHNDPSNADGYKETGLIYFKLDNQDSAEICLRKALALNPWDAETHFSLGELLDKQGNKPEARRHYLEALRINPDYRSAVEKLYK